MGWFLPILRGWAFIRIFTVYISSMNQTSWHKVFIIIFVWIVISDNFSFSSFNILLGIVSLFWIYWPMIMLHYSICSRAVSRAHNVAITILAYPSIIDGLMLQSLNFFFLNKQLRIFKFKHKYFTVKRLFLLFIIA